MEPQTVEQKLDQLTTDFKELKDALIGNDMTKGMGWIDRIKDLESDQQAHRERIEILENREKQIVTVVATIVGIGVIIEFALAIYTGVFKK